MDVSRQYLVSVGNKPASNHHETRTQKMFTLKFAMVQATKRDLPVYCNADTGAVSLELMAGWTHLALPGGDVLEAEG